LFRKLLLALTGVLLLGATRLAAVPGLVGFSGAPGTLGSCAIHCHGTIGGSILVSGFPVEYEPGDTYRINVSHHGGEAISNFNASVRRANDTPCEGALVPGPNLELYSSGTDSIGIHFSSANQDSGWFLWIAPAPGDDSVELYLSGMQGTSMAGLSTLVRLVAAKAPGGVAENPGKGTLPVRFELLNRLVRDYLILRWQSRGPQAVRIDVIEPSGRRVATLAAGAGSAGEEYRLWKPVSRQGGALAPGSYFAVLTAGTLRLTRRFTVIR
jgi:hypothetical protein